MVLKHHPGKRKYTHIRVVMKEDRDAYRELIQIYIYNSRLQVNLGIIGTNIRKAFVIIKETYTVTQLYTNKTEHLL